MLLAAQYSFWGRQDQKYTVCHKEETNQRQQSRY